MTAPVTTTAAVPPSGAVFPKKSYLNDGTTIRSWLLTHDHKRIALLYLVGTAHRVSSWAASSPWSSGSSCSRPGRPSSRR